jgi:hypothetical protein
MRVQVKATAKCYNENDGKSLRYNFQTAYGSDKRPYNDNEVDFLILVALDIRIAQFILPINNKTKKIYEKQMTIENERNTFNIIKNTLFNKCLCS